MSNRLAQTARLAGLLDFAVFALIISPILLWLVVRFDSWDQNANEYQIVFSSEFDELLTRGAELASYLGLVFVLLKDVLFFSMGRKVYRLEIIDRTTGIQASKFKRIGRNIPLVLFPVIELPMKLLFPTARLGDMLFNIELRALS